MRVLLVQPMAETGGSDVGLLRLVRRLSADGVEVHVVVPAPHPLTPELRAAGASLHRVPMRRVTTHAGLGWWLLYALAWPLAVLRIAVLAARVRADVLASNSLHSWYGFAAAALLRRPHVWHAREIVFQSGAALRLERALVGRFCDLLVAASRCVADQFADVLAPQQVLVVHEDVDRQEFSSAHAGRFRPGARLPDDAVVVGYVGRLFDGKGVEDLLAAFEQLREQSPQVHLAVVGPDVEHQRGYADGLRRRWPQDERVHWVGPTDDVPAVMADLDVLVLPSSTAEAYGLVLVEALASGCRVVTVDVGGPPEIVALANAGAGVVVPPRDTAALAAALHTVTDGVRTSTALRRRRPPLLEPIRSDVVSAYRSLVRRGGPDGARPDGGRPDEGKSECTG